MTSIVVTGASGFVGRTLCRLLEDTERVEVLAVSRTPTENTQFVTDYRETPDADVLVHLAEDRTGRQAEDNLPRLASLSIERYNRVVYASSVSVYGANLAETCSPDTEPNPTSDYGRSKLACEGLIVSHPGGTVARLTNLYGDGMAEQSVIAEIMSQLSAPHSIRIGNGLAQRDFLSVIDAATALAAMALCEKPGVFNVASGRSISIMALARMVLAQAGQDGRDIEMSHRTADCLGLDISATTEAFGWRPEVSLESGLRELIENYAQ